MEGSNKGNRAALIATSGMVLAVCGPLVIYADVWGVTPSLLKLAALTLGSAIAFTASLWVAREGSVGHIPRAMDVVVGGFAVWVALAALNAPHVSLSISGAAPYWDGLLATAAAAGCYFAARRLLLSSYASRFRRVVMVAVSASFVLLAAVVAPALVGGVNPDFVVNGRIASLTAQPVFLAASLVTWIPLLVSIAPVCLRAVTRAVHLIDRFEAGLMLAGLVSAVALLLGTQSRAGWLAAAMGVGLYYIGAAKGWRPRSIAIVLTTALVTAAFISVVAIRSAGTSSSLTSTVEQSVAYEVEGPRIVAWRVAGQALLEKPLLGLGPGMFGYFHASRITPTEFLAEPVDLWLDAHNWYLNSAATSGLPAAIATLLMIAAAPLIAWSVRGRSVLGTAASAAMVGYGMQMAFTPNSIMSTAGFFTLLAIAVDSTRREAGEPAPAPTGTRLALRYVGVAVSVLVAVWGVRLTAAGYTNGYGKTHEDESYLTLATTLAPEVGSYFTDLAFHLLQEPQNEERGVRMLEMLVDSMPEDHFVAMVAGEGTAWAAARLNDPVKRARQLDLALVFLSRSTELAPSHLENRVAMARVLALRGRTREADEEFENIRRAFGYDSEQMADVYAMLPQLSGAPVR